MTKFNPRIGEVDSAGTGAYHTNEPPDDRTMETLEKHGIVGYDHGARKVEKEDLNNFDYIFAMDRHNLQSLQRMQRIAEQKQGAVRANVSLFGAYAGKKKAEEVIDPYYGEDDGFEEVYEQVHRFSKNFLKDVVDTTSEAKEVAS